MPTTSREWGIVSSTPSSTTTRGWPTPKYMMTRKRPLPSGCFSGPLDYALNKGASGYHTLGTCRIGPDPEDVVDERLRVRGVDGLRVVDASIFPAQPSGNNNAPTIAAAWIAAEMILEDATGETINLVQKVPAEGETAPGPVVSAVTTR